jgi:uncharacterized protein (DUF4213/DUF364 family)
MTLKHTSFIVIGAILIVVVVAVAAYGANVGNAQGTNMMKNMSRSIKMIAPGGNMSNTINMTVGGVGKTVKMIAPGGNMSNTINMTTREWNLGKTVKIIH